MARVLSAWSGRSTPAPRSVTSGRCRRRVTHLRHFEKRWMIPKRAIPYTGKPDFFKLARHCRQFSAYLWSGHAGSPPHCDVWSVAHVNVHRSRKAAPLSFGVFRYESIIGDEAEIIRLIILYVNENIDEIESDMKMSELLFVEDLFIQSLLPLFWTSMVLTLFVLMAVIFGGASYKI